MASQKMINSVLRASDILRNLSDGPGRISDLSKILNLSKGTLHRFLKSLEFAGLVRQDPITRKYNLGPLVLELASKPIISHQNLISCASEEMKYLRDLTGETVVIQIRVGPERICLEELQSTQDIKYSARKGFVAPIYTGSAGKVLLSQLRDDELHILLKNIRLIPIGPNTITDKKLLLEELHKVRENEYATSFGERIAGAGSIAVPVNNYVCPVALGVLGPDNRFSLKVIMRFLQEIKDAASRISSKLIEARKYKSEYQGLNYKK